MEHCVAQLNGHDTVVFRSNCGGGSGAKSTNGCTQSAGSQSSGNLK